MAEPRPEHMAEHPLATREPLSQANVAKAFEKARLAGFSRREDGEGAKRDKNFRKASLRDIARELVLSAAAAPAPPAPPLAGADPLPKPAPANAGHAPGLDAVEDADLIGEADLEALPGGDGPQPAPAAPPPSAPAAPAAQAPAPPDEALLAQLREEAYQEGFAAGRAMTDSARETELSQRIVDLETLLARLADPGIIDMTALRTQIRAAVLQLASARAGQAIDTLPAPFLARLEGMLQSVGHLAGQRDLFLSPGDLAAVQEAVPAHARLSTVRLCADATLARGDARLRVGGAEICDLLAPPPEGARDTAAEPAAETAAEAQAAPPDQPPTPSAPR